MAERSKFQFRMPDVLWAVSLNGISLGLALACWRINAQYVFESRATAREETGPLIVWESLLIASYVGAAVCFGAGTGCLFRKPLWGPSLEQQAP